MARARDAGAARSRRVCFPLAAARQLLTNCRTHTKHSDSGRVFAGSRSLAYMKSSSPNRTDAARLLTSGFRLLRFPEPLESEFRTEHRARLRAWNRLAIIVSACTVTGFAILDHFVL